MENKKVKVGIVGLGRLGYRHAGDPAFRIPNCELLAVCSVVENEVKEVQKWGISYGYADYDEMLKNREPDAIFIASPIASPSGFHCGQIENALQHGFHCILENRQPYFIRSVCRLFFISRKTIPKV